MTVLSFFIVTWSSGGKINHICGLRPAIYEVITRHIWVEFLVSYLRVLINVDK